MEKKCKTCAWFCHTDGKCYANTAMLDGWEVGLPKLEEDGWTCPKWAYDGLEDWEREEWDAQ